MDIRIGITDSGQVVEVELAEETDRDALKAEVEAVLVDTSKVLWLTDRRGKETAIPGGQVAFAEISEADADRRIGFGA
jgi:hypothetical protein